MKSKWTLLLNWAKTHPAQSSTTVRHLPVEADLSVSKVLAERAFWDFFKTNKPSFDGVATLPGAIFGPPTQFADALTGAVQMIQPWLQGPKPREQLNKAYYNVVHVADG